MPGICVPQPGVTWPAGRRCRRWQHQPLRGKANSRRATVTRGGWSSRLGRGGEKEEEEEEEALYRSPSPHPEGGSSRRGSFVFTPLTLRHPALALNAPAPWKTTPDEAPSQLLPLSLQSPLHPLHPCAACPLARHPSIDFVTNRLQPPRLTLAPSLADSAWNDTRRCVYMRLHTAVFIVYSCTRARYACS